MFVKDLRILNRDLTKLVIVDNSILSFALQLNNGVPIIPFYNDKSDAIFPLLTNYLISLEGLEDYRSGNLQMFGMQYLFDPNVENFINYYISIIRQHAELNNIFAKKKRILPPSSKEEPNKVKKCEE